MPAQKNSLKCHLLTKTCRLPYLIASFFGAHVWTAWDKSNWKVLAVDVVDFNLRPFLVFSICRATTKGIAWTARAVTPHIQQYWQGQTCNKLNSSTSSGSSSSSTMLPHLVYGWVRCSSQVVLGFLVVRMMAADRASEQEYGHLLEQASKALVHMIERMDLAIVKHTVGD